MEDPFLEHPTGRFRSALDALEDAVRRLRALPRWSEWITITAQGQGYRPDSHQIEEVRMLLDLLDVGDRPLELPVILKAAKAPEGALSARGPHYGIGDVSARQVALILDVIFRLHFKIRPFPDEGNDYAVGAEW